MNLQKADLAEINLSNFLDAAVANGLYSNADNLRQYLSVLFGGVEFRDKSFLDVGGGSGVFTLYAASRGAQRAICLEPESDGSTAGAGENFNRVRDALGLGSGVEMLHCFYQEYQGEPFDFVLLHNSINHFDEEACETLLESEESRQRYRALFEQLYRMVSPGGLLIACDCSRRNLFGDAGLTNPFMKTIEWEKHQQPEVWSSLLSDVGFIERSIHWNTFNSLGALGAKLFGNSVASYLTLSHFRLYMEKPLKELAE